MQKFILIFICFIALISLSCNMFMVAVRNVSLFFSGPDVVDVKVKDPIKSDVRLSALWIGHSTVLLQMDDKVIITDPVLTETVCELARRVVDPGIDIENIPKCDLILISHSHFDHLSLGSLEILEKKSKNAALVFPKDLEKYLPDYDFKYVRMNNDNGYKNKFIGETKIIKGIKVTTVYARHWGGRYGLDGYLWGDLAYTGYILEYNGLCGYFAGDTGYDSLKFKEIGETFKIQLGLIPIGACADCENGGTSHHVFPPDAIDLFKDINAKWMIPIHYGTMMFAQAEPMRPVYALKKIVAAQQLEDKVKILKIGEQYVFMKR